MGLVVLLIIALLPIFLIGLFMYKKDQNKEPKNLLIKLFFGGIGSTFLVLFLSLILRIIVPFFGLELINLNTINLIVYVFIGIAFIEEISKWIFIYKISYNNKEFDEFYDILLYSAFVALGFAGLENILYVLQNGFSNGLIRAFTAVPGHVFDGIFMGYYLGLAKLNSLNGREQQKKKNIILSIVVPTLSHGIYDYCLYASAISYNFMFIIVWICFVLFMYIYCIKRIMKVSKLTGNFVKNNNVNINTNYSNNYNNTYNNLNNNKYCSNCGNIINGAFCSNCGRKNY